MAKNRKVGLMEKNFKDIKSRLERIVRGITQDTEDKLLPKDTGDELDDLLGSLIKTFDKGENKSISEIIGKHNGDSLSDIIDAQFNSDVYKSTIITNIMYASIDRIREQQYMIRNMPQISKVIKAMTNSIMSPSTQSNETSEIMVKHATIGNKDVMDLLKLKKFQEKERKCIINALSYGAGFMQIYPYADMAEDILDIGGIATSTKELKDHRNKLILASDIDSLMMTDFYGESFQVNNDTPDIDGSISIKDIRKGISNILYHECDNQSLDKDVELISESLKNNNYDEYDSRVSNLVRKRFFSENLITQDVACSFIDSITGSENVGDFYNEANRMVDKRKLKNIKGAYVKVLEEDKFIPVYLNQELVGGYYIDYDTDFSENTPLYTANRRNLSQFSRRRNYKLNQLTTMGVAGDIKEAIAKLLKDEMDERFLSNNKHVLATIEKIMRDTKLDSIEEYFMIRWIPKKYIVEYKNDDRESQLANVEPLVICWITLWRHYMLRKVFYERDLRYIKFLVTDGDDDFQGQGMRALQMWRTMQPSPADVYSYRNTTMSISNTNKFAMPMTRDGLTPLTIDKIEGQKPDDNIFDELVRLASIITDEVGFSYTMLDPSTSVETATQLIASREDKAEMIINKQILFNEPKSEAINKIAKYEWGHNDLDIYARFPEIRVMKQGIFADMSDKLNAKLDLIMNNMYAKEMESDKEKVLYMRKELFKYYISTIIDIPYIEKLEEQYKYNRVFAKKDNSNNTGDDNG